MSAQELITNHLDLWTSATTHAANGRGKNGKVELTGIQKLRELILELAVRGKLVNQSPADGPSTALIAEIETEKARLVNSKEIKKPKPTQPVSEKDKPFSIPETWGWHSLGAAGYTQTGSTPSKSNSEFFGGDIPFIKPGDISENGDVGYDNEGLTATGKAALGKWAKKNSLLMVCIGTIGKCGLIDRQVTFNQQINSLTPYIPEMSRFLLLCLKSPYFQEAGWGKSSSTTISILNKGKWESIPVPVPPLEEQHRIVQKVDELMALCDRLEQQTSDQLEAHETLVDTLLNTLTQSENATELADNWARLAAHFDILFTTEQSIDKLKKTIMQLAVMGRLVEQDATDESARTFRKKIAESKEKLMAAGEIRKQKPHSSLQREDLKTLLPKKWEWATFGEVTFNRDAERIPLSVEERQRRTGQFDYYGASGAIDKIDDYLFDKPLLLIGEDGANLLNRSTPIAFIASGKYWVNNHAHVIDGVSQDFLKYLCLYINAISLEPYVTGTAQPKMNQAKLNSIPVPLPPEGEQVRIVQKVDELMALCNQLKERLNQISETRCKLAESVVEGALQA